MNLFEKREKNQKDFSIEEYYKTIEKELDDKQKKLDEMMGNHDRELFDMFDKSTNNKPEEDWFDKMIEEERKKRR